jgi:hypothetical protein
MKFLNLKKLYNILKWYYKEFLPWYKANYVDVKLITTSEIGKPPPPVPPGE